MISNTVRRSLKMLSWFLFLMICLLFVAVRAKAEPQLALFPFKNDLCITQISPGYISDGYGTGGLLSHVYKGSYALDLNDATKGERTLKAYAPFDAYAGMNGGFLVIYSKEPVMLSNGTTSHVYMCFAHENMEANKWPELPQVKEIKQGEHFYTEGNAGNATGIHIHFEMGLGTYNNNNWVTYYYNNGVEVNEGYGEPANSFKYGVNPFNYLWFDPGLKISTENVAVKVDKFNESIANKRIPEKQVVIVSPSIIDFGPQYLGLDAPLRRTITITNSGTTNITLNTDIHSEHFIVESFSKTELSPGESATALVSFKCELPVGVYEETVNIQAVGSDDGQTVTVPLELKMESAYFEIPERLSCENCLSKHTKVRKGMITSHSGIKSNGDGTHTAKICYFYSVQCLDCGMESEDVRSDTYIKVGDCYYYDQGTCICGDTFLTCTHGLEEYEETGWEHVYYTPTYLNETYHWQPYMLFYYYECSICGAKASQSYLSQQREEVHFYNTDGICACGAAGEPSTCRHEDPRYSKIVEENVKYEDITAETHMKIADQYDLEWCVDCGEMCSRDLWKKSVVTVEGHSPVGGVCACGYRSEDISVYPDTIDFGVQYIGEEMPFRRLITITNSGTTDIELNTDIQSEYFIVESFSKEKLSSGESATAVVLFKVGMPAGTYEEIVNIEATNDHSQSVVSIPLKLKIQHVLIEVPANPLCEYCQSDNTEVRSFIMIHDAVYNGDSTHTADCSYCYSVNCLDCHEEYQKTLHRSMTSFVCGYNDQGTCYTCGHNYLACAHGKENYVKTGYEMENYTPVFKNEDYHFLPGTFFWCYECSICGAKARESYASTSEEEHYHYADGMCACGYRIGCETHEFVNGVCSICGRPDLDSMNATLTLPANIKNIKMEAFTGSGAEAIIVADGCLTIGERAFAECENLKCVVLPDSLMEIAEDAFAGCVDLVIFAPQNSIAHEYAQEHGYMWYDM